MIQVTNLSKHFGVQTLFENISFTLAHGNKIGFVGRNGSGKSTLFKILLGEEEADSGEILIPKNYTIGTLRQHILFTHKTVREECASALHGDEAFDLYKIEKMLFGLGFSQEDLDKDPMNFSGGYQIRLNLVKLLATNPSLLLLDEPTNYLDIISMRWLQTFLKEFKGEIILITHDRDFMDAVTTHTMGLRRKSLMIVEGNSSKYYAKLEEDDERYLKTKANLDKKRAELEDFVTRQKARASKAVMAQSKAKQLEKMGEMDDLEVESSLHFSFNYKKTPAKIMLEAKDVSFGYDPAHPLFQSLSFKLEKGKCLAIIGKNGKGKSTLLNVIAGELPLQQGTLSFHPETTFAHFGQTNIQRLNLKNSIIDEIYEVDPLLGITRVRAICGGMMFSGKMAEKEISILSGGERSRVMLGKIIATPANLLFLDEPTNHLDMYSIDSLCEAIKNFKGSTILVTHSEMMLRELADALIIFHHDKAEFFDGNYDAFLEKIGWEEEIDVAPKKVVSNDYNENKKLRAKLIQERSSKLSPLKKQIDQCEAKIMKLEEDIKVKNDALIACSSGNDIGELGRLSKEIKSAEETLEKLYEQFETLHVNHDTLFDTYEIQLKNI
ncbi:ABC-F family ATP-binding cassette domain-containing protein [Sulfurospirillum diekertiae]|uniref:ABC transporter ATP-binding protein YheS n=1 Tax=Sulfurospirillum diekertiae TaxID=1854492 RepID=A0A1Y0HKB7_9BACT|nr:ABC-F family ATP-binding cassette domain-containing protein [Sulfurospirillum diekertiae]ARU48567.1 putative ABC transporter ATP-binding protein YheS [Sulfurospirillum diekertiae]ASC93398.1 putative ABC transporter ATP-binding protein YheS [Sulfurospirillum diekertiae]